MRLTNKDKKDLLHMSRESILDKNYIPYSDSKILQSYCGVFVSLYLDDMLRGCIGKFNPNYELYKVTSDVSKLALGDSRFRRLEKSEIENVNVEISVLTPLKKIYNIDDIEIGRHGIYLFKNNKSGTFLPHVAIDNDWNLIEFLGHCVQDKMGLNWNDWKGADIFTYEAEVFNENEIK